MSLPEEPYRPPQTESAGDVRLFKFFRFVALGIALASAVLGVFFGFQLLVMFGFSAMIHPDITGGERTRMIVDRFLFGDSSEQILFVFVCCWITFTGLSSTIVHTISAITLCPDLRWSWLISVAVGSILAVAFVTMLLFIRG